MKKIHKNFEENVYSLTGADGIIKHIFKEIGYTNKIAVEIGVSDGLESNTQLLLSSGFKLLWIDYMPKSYIPDNTIMHTEFVTKDNIEPILQKYNIPQEFDLLSIDIDGNDYHIREALSNYKPRIVIMEYNGAFNSTSEYIMGYDENYRYDYNFGIKFGASLQSLVNQANRLGYDYVYSESNGVDAFFIRKDINPFKPLTSKEGWVELWWYKNKKLHQYENRNL